MRHSIILILLFNFSLAVGQTDSVRIVKDSVDAPLEKTPRVKKDTRPIKDRISFGLGTSFWLNSNTTHIEVSPSIAYRFPKRLVTGFGYRYIYRHNNIYSRNLNAYGPNFFARYSLFRPLYLWSEYEILQNEYLAQVGGKELMKQKQTTDSWFVGLGFVKSFNKKGRGGLGFQILYNILYEKDDFSPYYSAWTYRVGYFF